MRRLLSPLTLIATAAGAVGGAGAGLLLFDPLAAATGLVGLPAIGLIAGLVACCALVGATLIARLAPPPRSAVAVAIETAASPADVTPIDDATPVDTPSPIDPLETLLAADEARYGALPPTPTPAPGPRWLPTSAEHDPGFDLQIALEGGRLIPGFPVRAALRFSAYAPIAARAVRLRLSVPFDGRVADAWAQTWPINGLPDGERTVVVEIAAPVGLPEGRALIAVELEGEPGRSTPRRRGGALPIG
jgi:hypothetical protein